MCSIFFLKKVCHFALIQYSIQYENLSSAKETEKEREE